MRCRGWLLIVGVVSACHTTGLAQVRNPKYDQIDAFRQLDEVWPTATEVRLASGAPGPDYWQQQVDYVIDVELDDRRQRLAGREQITYHNRSPHALSYLWLQLDNNLLAPDSDAALTAEPPALDRLSTQALTSLLARRTFDGSLTITDVRDARQQPLPYTIVKTMMRVDLELPLAPGESFVFSVAWHYQINNAKEVSARTGYEFFEDDGNYIYEIAHWYPRLAAYTDYQAWQHKQFLGSGEFTLEFGNYLLRVTVPDDHLVAATGVLLNPDDVLTEAQRERLAAARQAERPMFVVTPDEARQNESHRPQGKKTWVFQADRVRDVAFASSRKFIWDAKLHRIDGREVMAMSFYPREGEPLWSRYSTHAIIHTLNVYSRYTFPYPYPVAISVNGPVGGMEYPMICFNGPRPEKDGTYSRDTKYGLISVVIHEVGHNYFPMIVNSDERQWTWMDEGLNTFLQSLAEQEWEDDYPSRSVQPERIVGAMRSAAQVPIMTSSDSLLQFSNNAYSKPTAGLHILRESILGRELFDTAFREYARRWQFKRPTPADFFRTMEDASGVDLDWFWRGWFYSTDHTDQAIERLRRVTLKSPDPEVDKARRRREREQEKAARSDTRDRDLPRYTDPFPELRDFYNEYDELDVTQRDRRRYQRFLDQLTAAEQKLLQQTGHFYVVDLANRGGLVMPVVLEIAFDDDSRQELRIPAEIWRRNNRQVSKLLITDKTIRTITLDPHREFADVDRGNNRWPPAVVESQFELYKPRERPNPMQPAGERGERAGRDRHERD